MAPALGRDEAVNQFTPLGPGGAAVGDGSAAVECDSITDVS